MYLFARTTPRDLVFAKRKCLEGAGSTASGSLVKFPPFLATVDEHGF